MRIQASQARYEEIDVKGTKALFSEQRILRESVPRPLCMYEVRHADEDWTEPAQIAGSVLVNFLGTLITEKPLDFPDGKSLYLEYGEVDFYPDKPKTLSEFLQDNSICAKKPKARER